MARMIPAVLPDNVESGAERMLYPVLRDGLDDHYTVFHSFDLLVSNHQGKLTDGEIDFLIFHPELGFLVLEVKGGALRYDGAEGIWYQNDKALKVSPFTQARNSKYKLRDFLKKKLGPNWECPLVHAVCFPEVLGEVKQLPSGADAAICITGRQLPHMGEAVKAVMLTSQNGQGRPLPPAEVERIRRVIMPMCEYGTSLVDKIGQAERVIFRLTEEQCRILDVMKNHRHARIEGCAGSGKTVMAVKKARELALAGKSVLLLAYNEMISEHLAASVAGIENIKASGYHRFCERHLEQAGMLPGQARTPEFYLNDVPEAFLKFLEHNPLKYDAIIVDEGQDFHDEYWATITEMLKVDSIFYIFYDPDQNVFGSKSVFPIDQPPFVLSENCRNTRSICEWLGPYTDNVMKPMADMPTGEQVMTEWAQGASARRKRLGKILHDLVNNEEIDREKIVILGGHSMRNTCIGEKPAIGNFRITETMEKGPNVINYRTYMKFKGCEADAVILIDVDPDDQRWATREAMYTAMSRAKHLLYILYSRRGEA